MIGVFGGAGFIGRNVVELFVDQGRSVLSLDRRRAPGFENISCLIEYTNPTTYLAKIKEIKTAIVLISASVPGTFADDMSGEVKSNILPFTCLVQNLAKGGVETIVFMSSGGTVYGIPQTVPIKEDHPLIPVSHYGFGKVLMEDILRFTSAKYGFRSVILRPSNPIGRYQRPGTQGIVSAAVSAALGGTHLDIWGDGSVVRDFFDVEDLAVAIDLVVRDADVSGNFNVGSGRGYSIREVVNEVQKITGRTIDVSYGTPRPFDIQTNVLSYKKLNRSVGWEPSKPLSYSISRKMQGFS